MSMEVPDGPQAQAHFEDLLTRFLSETGEVDCEAVHLRPLSGFGTLHGEVASAVDSRRPLQLAVNLSGGAFGFEVKPGFGYEEQRADVYPVRQYGVEEYPRYLVVSRDPMATTAELLTFRTVPVDAVK